MFKRNVLPLADVLNQFLRQEGLETPLLQRRLIEAWGTVAGQWVEKYTAEKFIRNQTLFVRLMNPALRSDLSMMKTELVGKLNEAVGAQVIMDIRFF